MDLEIVPVLNRVKHKTTVYAATEKIVEWILDVAVSEINEKTDLIVSYEPIKQNSRKTTHLFFTVQKKAKAMPAPAPTPKPQYKPPQKRVIEQNYSQRYYNPEEYDDIPEEQLEEMARLP